MGLLHLSNAAAIFIGHVAFHDHITTTLQQLNWLPVQYCITYKLCLLMHSTRTILFHWRCHTNYQCHIMSTTLVWQQSPLWATAHMTEVWTTSVFICCTGCVEQFTTIA